MPVGRPSIFSPKEEDIHGQVSRVGFARFSAARRALCNLTGWPNVSDGDVIEYLARGHAETQRYLKEKE